MGDDGDKRSLLWSPEEILSDSDSEKDNIKGKQVAGNNADVRIRIGSASDAVKREDLANLWTPDSSLLMPDDRLRRSSLWGSAVGNAVTDDEIREETRAGKRVAEIEAIVDEHDTDSDVESRGLLVHHSDGGVPSNGNPKFEIEPARSEIKEWVRRADQRQSSSMAERLSELLRPKTSAAASSPVVDAEVDGTGGDATARERRRFSDPGRISEKRVSQLNRPSLQRRNSLAMQVSERVPPEWVLLLLGCLLGLSSGISVVLFNKGVCLSVCFTSVNLVC